MKVDAEQSGRIPELRSARGRRLPRWTGTFLAMLCLAAAAAAAEPDATLSPLARLAGDCWQGEFGEGDSWDRHCFAWAYGGKFLRDTHAVTGRRGPYGGETWYRFDAGRQ